MRRHRCRKRFLGCPKNTQPQHGLGGRMDLSTSMSIREFQCTRGSGASSHPPSTPCLPPCSWVPLPRSELPQKLPGSSATWPSPPSGITPGKRVKIRGKGKFWIPHSGRQRLGELVGSEGKRGEGRGLVLQQKSVSKPPWLSSPSETPPLSAERLRSPLPAPAAGRRR